MIKKGLTLGEGETPLLRSIKAELYMKEKTEIYFKMENRNPAGGIVDRGVIRFFEEIKNCFIEGILVYGDPELAISVSAYGARAGRPVYNYLQAANYSEECYEKIVKYDGRAYLVSGEQEELKGIFREISEGYPYKFADYELDCFYVGIKSVVDELKNELGEFNRVFAGAFDTDMEKMAILQKACKDAGVELVLAVYSGSSIATENNNIKNIEIERFEAGEAKMLLKSEGIEFGEKDSLAFAAVMKYDREKKLKTDEKNVVLILGDKAVNAEEFIGIERVEASCESIKKAIGLK